jgi:hypothetical protein
VNQEFNSTSALPLDIKHLPTQALKHQQTHYQTGREVHETTI